MKRKLLLVLLSVTVALSVAFALAGCKPKTEYALTLDKTSILLEKGESIELPYQLTKNGELDTTTEIAVTVEGDSVTYTADTHTITAVKAGRSSLTVTVPAQSDIKATLIVNVPEYTIELADGESKEVDLGATVTLSYTVKKDNVRVTDKQVTVTATGDAVKYNAVGDRLTFEKVGTGTVRVALKDDPSVYAETVYTVTKSFWSSEYAVNRNLMTITEDSVVMPGGGGNQYSLFAMDGGYKYVFKATLKIPSASVLGTISSVGVAHTIDKNDHSLWFGIQGAANSDGYNVLIKDYYGGWAGQDYRINAFMNITFDSDEVDFIIVRDGQNYWYSIGGYVGVWTANGATDVAAEQNSWAGVYSQENKLTVTNFSYSAEDSDIAAAKDICEAELSKFEITNADRTSLVKGQSFTYEVKRIGSANQTTVSPLPDVEWEIDKTEMTAGAENTTLVGGVLTLAEDAAGFVTVKANCGGIQRTVKVNISQESLRDENDTLVVDGGVVLGEDGSVTFTEENNSNNPTLNYNQYTDVFYSATLKDTVKGDFDIEFKVTDLKGNNPVLMVSLGGQGNNFRITKNSVVLNGNTVDVTKAYGPVQDATAAFTAAEELNVKISVSAGIYTVTVNGTPLAFGGYSAVVRRVEDYASDCKILFTTLAGTSCKVSDIKITEGDIAELVILNDNTVATENGFTTAIANLGWDAKDKRLASTYYAQLLPEGDFTVTMDVTFNTALSDGKFAINIGNSDFYVNNKIAGGAVQGECNFQGTTTTEITATGTFKVTLKKIDGSAYFYIGNTRIGDKFDGSKLGRVMYMWAGNFDANLVADSAVTVENLTVTPGAVILEPIVGEAGIQAGSTSSAYTVNVIGANEEDLVWAMNDENLTAGSATWDEDNKQITFSTDAAGSVVLTVSVGGESVSLTVSVTEQPANQNTALAESVGGVKQNVETGVITFDNSEINGIADEHKYAESGYYAILNSEAGKRVEIRDNYIVQFTVSDYVVAEGTQSPKLMISMGNVFEQFYVAYTPDGARIETFVMGLTDNSKFGRWVTSGYFADFDTTAAHTYKIVCEDGYYKVYVDNNEVTSWNSTDAIFRSVDSMAIARNIMVSTNSGVTCNVSDISVTAVEGKEGKVTATYSNRFTTNEDGSVSVKLDTKSEGGRGGYHNAKSIYAYGEYIPDDCEITMTVAFSEGNYPDEALIIRFGSDRSFAVAMNTGNADGTKIEQQYTWGGTSMINGTNALINNTVKIRIVVEGGYVTAVCMMTHDAEGNETGWSNSIALNGGDIEDQKVNGVLSFGTFIEKEPSNNTVTVSGITVTPTAQGNQSAGE